MRAKTILRGMLQFAAVRASISLFLLLGVASVFSQQVATTNSTVVPALVNFSGTLTDINGKPLTGVVGVTFFLYTDQQALSPLWMETQNVTLDKFGHYSVQLGSTSSTGLPADIFVAGEARWLGVQPQGQAEYPRVMLLSVPYALKAGDAQTIGGLPPSAFVLATPPQSAAASTAAPAGTSSLSAPPPSSPITGTGTVNFLPLWDTTSDIVSSVVFQSGMGSTAKIGINTTTPVSTLDIRGGTTVRGTLSLPAIGSATAAAGKNSQPFAAAASAFNSSTTKAVTQTFLWQAEPAGNNTATPSGTLNLLFGSGTSLPAETGLKVASNGQITFATGQTFPGTGNGTITGVTAGGGLSGGGTSGSVTLNVDSTQVPFLNSANTFTQSQVVSGNLTATGTVTGSAFQIGSNLFDSGAYLNGNAFTGFAGSTATTGSSNTATGVSALSSDTTGRNNTAGGEGALQSNTLGSWNTAIGAQAMYLNKGDASGNGDNNTAVGSEALFANTGSGNTAVGSVALESNTSGQGNTAAGEGALFDNTVGFSNTAVGASALYDSTGNDNSANGVGALQTNTTGNYNTAMGGFAGTAVDGSKISASNNTFLGALSAMSTGSLTNATAIGANAEVSASNSLVLGSISGVNGATASTNVGIGTTSPLATLDVHGTGNFTGFITFASGQPFPGAGTVSSVGSGAGLTGGPITGSGSLSIATGGVSNAMLANSSLTINHGTDLVGGGLVSLGGSTTLDLDTTKVPLLAASNTFTGNQAVSGNLSATGIITGSGFQIGSNLFDYGNYGFANAFLGFAGNTTMTGSADTGTGSLALFSNTSGTFNTASGSDALYHNTTGNWNTATGYGALFSNISGGLNTAIGDDSLSSNTSGSNNTASGLNALLSNTSGNSNTGNGESTLSSNTTGSLNTAGGYGALFANTTGSSNTAMGSLSGVTTDNSNLTANNDTFLGASTYVSTGTISNATAIGANAEVAQSNALVLGSINGVNGATADTAVGIGTTTPFNTPLAGNPSTTLNIVGNSTYVPLVVQSPSTFGTWMVLNNTSSGGKPWAILSAASGNGEGAGNLAITDFGAGGTIFLESNVQISGNLSKGGGSFKIDHPLDPANKYLSHSFVESPDMMNVYNGNIRTDQRGFAVVTLPDYFEALNRDFRYQLTVIGQFAQAIVATKISHNRFTIRTSRPRVEVSWQVTGIRHDAFADAHRIPNEEEKPLQERGHYLHPELFGAPAEQAIGMRLPVSPQDKVETTQTLRQLR